MQVYTDFSTYSSVPHCQGEKISPLSVSIVIFQLNFSITFCNSSIFSIWFTLLLISVAWLNPLIYHAICFLISLIAVYSPLYSTNILKCFSIIFLTSSQFLSNFSPDIISLKIHGLPKTSPSYHYGIAICIFKHFICCFNISYVSISNDGSGRTTNIWVKYALLMENG